MKSWLNVNVQKGLGGKYEHALAQENGAGRSSVLPDLRKLVSDAHEDARRRLRRLAWGSLDPLGTAGEKDPAEGYPETLPMQTLKGYFGEVLAGAVAECLNPFGIKDWEVPAFLFRFHSAAFERLARTRQTGVSGGAVPGRPGEDCLAFSRSGDGEIVKALFCEAKCTAGHQAGMISSAHKQASSPNLLPVDLLQLIEVLGESTDPTAGTWIDALRTLYLEGPSPKYERLDQITYICGKRPAQRNGKSWIPGGKPHSDYTGGRRLYVAEVQLNNDVEGLIKRAYGVT